MVFFFFRAPFLQFIMMPALMTNRRTAAKQQRKAARSEAARQAGANAENGENLTSAASGTTVLRAEQVAMLQFYVSMFDSAVPLGAFVQRSILVDEFICVVAFHLLLRADLDVALWAANVPYALMLAGESARSTDCLSMLSAKIEKIWRLIYFFAVQVRIGRLTSSVWFFALTLLQMHEDSDDYGYIEIVKFWCEQRGYAVDLYDGIANQFVVLGSHCDEFNRGKNALWTRLGFKLHVAPRQIFGTLAFIKAHCGNIAQLPVRSDQKLDEIIQLRRDSGLRLWVDRRVATKARARPTTRAATAAGAAASAAAAAVQAAAAAALAQVQAQGVKRKSDEMAPHLWPRLPAIMCSPSKSDSSTTASDDEDANDNSVVPAHKRRLNLLCTEQLVAPDPKEQEQEKHEHEDEDDEIVNIVDSDSRAQPVAKWSNFFARQADDENENNNGNRSTNVVDVNGNVNVDNNNSFFNSVGASFLSGVFNSILQN
jgi:hypothetical protein